MLDEIYDIEHVIRMIKYAFQSICRDGERSDV